MKLLQRYIFGELVRVFSLLVVVLTIMLVFVGLFREATERGLGMVQILQIMPFVVPSMLPFTIPATLLLAVCVVYGRISGDLEVIAAKAAGVSANQLLAPAFLLGAILTVGSFGLTNFAIPWAVDNIERIVTQAIEDIFLDVLTSQHHYSDANKGYSITVHDVRNRTLIDATFQYRASNHQQISVRAREARIRFDLERKEIRLTLKDAQGSRAGSDSEAELGRTELSFPLPEQIGKAKARHLTLSTLKTRIAESIELQKTKDVQVNQEAIAMLLTGDFSELTGASMAKMMHEKKKALEDERRFRAEIYSRFSMSASCLFFAFVGGPFSMFQARRQFITSFIMCFLPILLVYYPVMFLMMNLSKNGTVDPWWAMWIPNLILGVVGMIVLRKVVQH
ncbi:MAG: LptF/LptG family permease [Planctomycetaceae bacterium]|nr:LptF/LptG family permease [Planctomycetaceae bacterium]